MQATYSPEDNKLRLYSLERLDPETYKRVREAGFIWAPKQQLFVAPMWTPGREDLLIELAGEVGDEDTSLVDRAEARAERFEDYSENRAKDAEQAHKAVAAIADNIPMGQPILVGHHSEKHARKDAEKIENGMRRAVKMWDQSQYWKSRAAGAIQAAKYKERPDVRARRIKGLEADQRKQQKIKDSSEKIIKAWNANGLTQERALQISNYFDHTSKCFTLAEFPRALPASQYEGMMSLWSALDGGIINAEQAKEISVRVHTRQIARSDRWLAHLSNRLEYERAMLGESGGTATDRTGPEKGGACRCWASPGRFDGGWSYIQKVNKVSVTVLDNWGNGGQNFTRTIQFDQLKAVMSKAEVEAAREAGKLKEIDARGFFLMQSREEFDASETKPPEPETEAPQAEKFDALRDTLKAGVKIVSAPQLFVTPRELAARMVEEAGIRAGQTVLEPSAGTGRIVDALDACPTAQITAIEINSTLADNLRLRSRTSARVICFDFLEYGEVNKFDRILMNPPFADGQDIKHILRAFEMLNPGGRLVAICANGPRQNDKLRPFVEERGGTWEELPADTFKEAGTGVNTVLLVVDADEEPEPPTEKFNRPPADLSAKAGDLERRAPLFRDTDASGQQRLF